MSKIRVDSSEKDSLLFTVSCFSTHMVKLSYTKGDYLAFSDGRNLILHNISIPKQSFFIDVFQSHQSKIGTIAMAPSGCKVCYSIKGKVYVMQIKENQQVFPIQHYGFTNVIGPMVARIYPNDSTIAMSVLHSESLSSVAQYDLYSGKQFT